MGYHALSFLIIDPIGSILHIAAAWCFEGQLRNAGVRWHDEELVGWYVMSGHDQSGPGFLKSPTVLEPE